MENPFEILENRLAGIENKLDGLIRAINSPSSALPTWMTTKQLAQQLGVSSSFITNLRGSKLPYYKLGGKVYFKKQEVDEFIEKTRHKAGGEYLEEYLRR
jgi:excisionase family DNA binding protein